MVCWAGKLGWHATDGLMMRHEPEEGDGLAGADWYHATAGPKGDEAVDWFEVEPVGVAAAAGVRAVAGDGWEEDPGGVKLVARETEPAAVRAVAGDDRVVGPGDEVGAAHDEVGPADDEAGAVPEAGCDDVEVPPGGEVGPDDAEAAAAGEAEEAVDAVVTEAGDAAATGVEDVSAVGSVLYLLQTCDVLWSNRCHL